MALILIADDDAAVRDSIAELLGVDGHETVHAEDGRQCETVLRRRLPDLLIIDIFMPERDGIETIRALRRTHPDLKILAISGGGDLKLERSLHFAREFGADEVLAKPFAHTDLRVLVNTLLQRGLRNVADGA